MAIKSSTDDDCHYSSYDENGSGDDDSSTHNLIVQHNYHDRANDPIILDHPNLLHDGSVHPTPNRGGVAVPFPLKLYDMLEQIEQSSNERNNENQQRESDIASWQPHGRCFLIHNLELFKTTILPKYFPKLHKVTSFQRQLNLYGFLRLTKGPDKSGYYHECFLRGRKDLLKLFIRSKVKGTKVRAKSNPDTEPDFYNTIPWVRKTSTESCPATTTIESSSPSQIATEIATTNISVPSSSKKRKSSSSIRNSNSPKKQKNKPPRPLPVASVSDDDNDNLQSSTDTIPEEIIQNVFANVLASQPLMQLQQTSRAMQKQGTTTSSSPSLVSQLININNDVTFHPIDTNTRPVAETTNTTSHNVGYCGFGSSVTPLRKPVLLSSVPEYHRSIYSSSSSLTMNPIAMATMLNHSPRLTSANANKHYTTNIENNYNSSNGSISSELITIEMEDTMLHLSDVEFGNLLDDVLYDEEYFDFDSAVRFVVGV